jgi:hypothetical protein
MRDGYARDKVGTRGMTILALVYDFEHFKSAQGLLQLKLSGFNDVVAIGAPWRALGIAESHFQFKTRAMKDAQHPRAVCEALGFEYHSMPHDDPYVSSVLSVCDMGLVLGARVLGEDIAENPTPIINLHPGVLPANRGLDTLKWAVHEDLPQAITAHAIDKRIDRGAFIMECVLPVFEEDSYADIYNRMMWEQVKLAPVAINAALQTDLQPDIGEGTYRKPMTLEQDVATMQRFMAYKCRYDAIIDTWEAQYA